MEYFGQARTVVRIDLRGFGKSAFEEDRDDGVVEGGEEYSMASLADDCARVLDAHQIREPIVLCGLSMGGYIAFEFWRRYRDRLAGLILCDTKASTDSTTAAIKRLEMARQAREQGTEAVVAGMADRFSRRIPGVKEICWG